MPSLCSACAYRLATVTGFCGPCTRERHPDTTDHRRCLANNRAARFRARARTAKLRLAPA